MNITNKNWKEFEKLALLTNNVAFEKAFTYYKEELLNKLPKEKKMTHNDKEQLWRNGYNQALKEIKELI